MSITRWSARADASKALITNYSEVVEALQVIMNKVDEKPNTRLEAKNLNEKLNLLENAIMVYFWNKILERFNETNKKLQTVNIDLGTVILLYDSLYNFVNTLRDSFDMFETEAINLCKNESYQHDIRREKRRKLQFGEKQEDSALNGKDNFRVEVFLPLIDKLKVELSRRRESYIEINAEYGFLNNLLVMTTTEIKEKCATLIEIYKNDLNDELEGEIIQVKDLGLSSNGLLDFLKQLKLKNIDSIFPNLVILLRMFACKAVTNCTGEKSFSVLKKDYRRSTLTNIKLNALAIMCIENNLLNGIDFSEIVNVFANAKARKKSFK